MTPAALWIFSRIRHQPPTRPSGIFHFSLTWRYKSWIGGFIFLSSAISSRTSALKMSLQVFLDFWPAVALTPPALFVFVRSFSAHLFVKGEPNGDFGDLPDAGDFDDAGVDSSVPWESTGVAHAGGVCGASVNSLPFV